MGSDRMLSCMFQSEIIKKWLNPNLTYDKIFWR